MNPHAMFCLWLILAACPLLYLVGCKKQPVSPERAVGVEVKLDDSLIPRVNDARIVILPTGERVLVMSGDNGMATCCVLPPKPEPAKVEK
jgi:hypothetical protein